MCANASIAKWLDEDDKQYIEDRMKLRGGGYTNAHATKKEILTTMFHPRMVVSQHAQTGISIMGNKLTSILCWQAHYFAYLCDMIPLGIPIH